jgi:hypothetical protein
MTTNWKTVLAAALCAAAFSQFIVAQVAPPTILQIDIENAVTYLEDTSDLSKFATSPSAVTAAPPKNFGFGVQIFDIVAVNGQPAKGTFTRSIRSTNLNTAPNPGQAISDTVRNNVLTDAIEILRSDGVQIGMIVAQGVGGGSAPIGGPLSITQGNSAIIGGTGAFLGARGQFGQSMTAQSVANRMTSVTEDPANRRVNGGGRTRFTLQVIPMSVPQIFNMFHVDFTPVTAAKPAKAGEALIAVASGLGPTRPGVDPGQPFPPFPGNPLQQVNSPVGVTVNGQSAEVINTIGWPGLVDTYRVDFRVPSGITTGPAAIQLSAAWILGPSVNIPIQ